MEVELSLYLGIHWVSWTIPGKVHIEAISCEGSPHITVGFAWTFIWGFPEPHGYSQVAPYPLFSWHLISALATAQNMGIIMKKPYLLLDFMCPGMLGSYAPHMVGEYYE